MLQETVYVATQFRSRFSSAKSDSYKVHALVQILFAQQGILDFSGFGEVIENLCLLALGRLGAIEIDADRNAPIRGARESLRRDRLAQRLRVQGFRPLHSE